jgi:hypothetical protein
MDGWLDGWMGGWVDGWMERCVDGWMNGSIGGWMGWMNVSLILRPSLEKRHIEICLAFSIPKTTVLFGY